MYYLPGGLIPLSSIDVPLPTFLSRRNLYIDEPPPSHPTDRISRRIDGLHSAIRRTHKRLPQIIEAMLRMYPQLAPFLASDHR